MYLLNEIPAFDEGGLLRMVVESPKGSSLKIKYESSLAAFRVKRSLPLGLAYPFDWGFIPGTLGEDGDPVDALSIHGTSSFPGVLMTCRVLGMVKVEQGKPDKRLLNPRIIVTPTWYEQPSELTSPLSSAFCEEIEHFFTTAGFFAEANPKILGWTGIEEAEQYIRSSMTPRNP